MSAYLCPSQHIAVLACYVAAKTNHYGDSGQLAEVLAITNVTSVGYRYNADGATTCQDFLGMGYPEYLAQCRHDTTVPAIQTAAANLPPLRIYGLAQCLNYQSCEHPEYNRSVAYKVLRTVIRETAIEIVDDLHGKGTINHGWDYTPGEGI